MPEREWVVIVIVAQHRSSSPHGGREKGQGLFDWRSKSLSKTPEASPALFSSGKGKVKSLLVEILTYQIH